jgi:hypothetical protein
VSLVAGKEVEQINALVAPGKRRTVEAEAMLRPLLALDGAVSGREDPPTSSELRKGLTAIRDGKDWRTILPGLASLEVAPAGKGRPDIEISLRISKDPAGVPIKLVEGNEADQALAYREINPFDKYPIRPSQFGPKLGLNTVQGYAISEALGLRDDSEYFWIKRAPKGYVIYQAYSAKALDRARTAIGGAEIDIDGAMKTYVGKRSRKS